MNLFCLNMILIQKLLNATLKLSNSQVNKLKSAAKNEIRITLKLSTNFIGDPNDTNLRYNFLLNNRQVSNLR